GGGRRLAAGTGRRLAHGDGGRLPRRGGAGRRGRGRRRQGRRLRPARREHRRHLRRALEAIVGILLQRLLHHHPDRLGHVRRQRRQGIPRVLERQGGGRLRLEGQPPRERPIEDHAAGVEVRPRVHLPPERLLRREEGGRPEDRPGGGEIHPMGGIEEL